MKPYHKTALWYAVLGFLWILLSDQVVHWCVRDPQKTHFYQTIKGWLFVVVSTLLIYYLTRRAYCAQQAEEAERKAVYNKTVSGAYHILLNYLNQMELVTLEAEKCKDFDQETLKLARTISDEASSELMKLNAITDVSSSNIEQMLQDSRNRQENSVN